MEGGSSFEQHLYSKTGQDSLFVWCEQFYFFRFVFGRGKCELIWYVQVQYYMLGLSLKFNPRLVISRKFRYCVPKTGAFTTRALLSRNYNARENSLQLPNPDTRNPLLTLRRKGRQFKSVGGTFVTHPTFWTSASLSHASPPPIAPFSPFEIPGRHNLSAPAAKPHPPPSATSPLPSRSLFPDDVIREEASAGQR